VTQPHRLCIIPRWSGTPQSDWYPWLTRRLAAETPVQYTPVLVQAMPEPQEPRIDTWVPAVRTLLGDDPAEIARTVIIGHSVGCQAVVRALATLPAGVSVAATVCVAGWWDVAEPWETLKPWIATPFDESRAQAAAGRLIVVLSDNDPYTPDHARNAAAWQRRLGAEVVMVPGGEHFNAGKAPAVWAILTNLSGAAPV
jgi:predicted alpha/beta hydrolase family esterase